MDSIIKLASTMKYKVFMFGGVLGFEFLGEYFPLSLFAFWIMFSLVDVILGWTIAIKGKTNTSAKLRDGFMVKMVEWLVVGMIICLLSHINFMIDDIYLSLIIGVCTLAVPTLFLLKEVQSNVENLILLTNRRNGALIWIGKLLGIATAIIDQKIARKREDVAVVRKASRLQVTRHTEDVKVERDAEDIQTTRDAEDVTSENKKEDKSE